MENLKNATSLITPDALQSKIFLINHLKFNNFSPDIKEMIMFYAYQKLRETGWDRNPLRQEEKQYKLAPLCREIFSKRLSYNNADLNHNTFFFNRCIFNDNRSYDENKDFIINEHNTIKSILVMKHNKNHITLTREKVDELLQLEQLEIIRIRRLGQVFHDEELLYDNELTPELINIYKQIDYYVRKYIHLTHYKFDQARHRSIDTPEDLEQIYTSYGNNYNICKNGNPHKDKGCFHNWSIYNTQKNYIELVNLGWGVEPDKVNYIRNVVEENDESEDGDECVVL